MSKSEVEATITVNANVNKPNVICRKILGRPLVAVAMANANIVDRRGLFYALKVIVLIEKHQLIFAVTLPKLISKSS